MDSVSLFEILPDEILLKICRYLYTAEVLYSFYNLNSRLNVTITGYCRHLNLSGMTYSQFNYIISNLLPQIAPFAQSFVFHYYRDNSWSAQVSPFFNLPCISSLFPQLRKIALYWYTGEELLPFINRLHDLPELRELNIRYLKGTAEKIVLPDIFTVNNCRLNSITFDSLSTYLEVVETSHPFAYPNIQKLTINIKNREMLPVLFHLIPQIQSLQVTIGPLLSESNLIDMFANRPALLHLTDFHLSSVEFWNLNEIHAMLRNMPSLQKLILDVVTNDEHFIKQEHFLANLPSSLRQIHFFICYYFSTVNFDVSSLIASWAVSIPIHCLVENNYECVFIFTTSPALQMLNLPATVSKQILQGCEFIQAIDDLFIFGGKSLSDILSTIQHFPRLRKLEVNAKDISDFTSSKQSILLNLHKLKELDVTGTCPLFDILKAAYNLDDLTLDIDCLKILIDDEPTRDLLQQRIICLRIRFETEIQLDLFQRIIRAFSRLRHLNIILNNPKIPIQPSLSIILTQSNIKQLKTIFVGSHITNEINIDRQWIVDHTSLSMDNEFIVDVLNGFFVLWK